MSQDLDKSVWVVVNTAPLNMGSELKSRYYKLSFSVVWRHSLINLETQHLIVSGINSISSSTELFLDYFIIFVMR